MGPLEPLLDAMGWAWRDLALPVALGVVGTSLLAFAWVLRWRLREACAMPLPREVRGLVLAWLAAIVAMMLLLPFEVFLLAASAATATFLGALWWTTRRARAA